MRTGKAILSVLLSAALLLGGLSACRPAAEQTGSFRSSSVSRSAVQPEGPASEPAGSGAHQDIPEDTGLQWDPDYRLDIRYPSVSPGKLELPVSGATGYASVTLPLWEEIPEPESELGAEEEPGTEPGTDQPAEPPAPGPDQPAVSDPGSGSEPGSEQPSEGASSSAGADASGEGTASSSAGADTSVPEEGDTSLQPAAAQSGGSSAPPSSSTPAASVLPDNSSGLAIAGPAPVPGTSQSASSGSGETIYAPGEEPLPEMPEPGPNPFEGAMAVLEPGTPFTVLKEEEDWWQVDCKAGVGWIQHRYCLINLPDVIPSMVYNATNSYDSRYVSVGKTIPKITGAAFYPGAVQNPRLGRREFMMPVLYSMAPRICQAQQAALAQGNTLVLYEGYRPHEVQRAVYRALSALSRTDAEVREGIASAPWSISWFIAGGYSNHQRGFAMDVSLARVERAQIQTIGEHEVLRVLEYEEYTMPTVIHELSKAAATFTAPVATHSPTAWRHAKLAPTMNEPALALQRCCTGAGLTPLASEWWHFNDLETRAAVLDNLSIGNYKITACLSTAP